MPVPRRFWLSRRGQRIAIAAAVIALLAAAIPAIATAATSPVTYYACVSRTGAIKLVSKSAACGRRMHKISWNRVGPRGQIGPAGITNAYSDIGPPLPNPHPLGPSPTTITKLSLPAGNFVFNATAAGRNTGGSMDAIFCSLLYNRTTIGNAFQSAPAGGWASVSANGMTGFIDTSHPATVDFNCFDETGTSSIAEAELDAIPVHSITAVSG